MALVASVLLTDTPPVLCACETAVPDASSDTSRHGQVSHSPQSDGRVGLDESSMVAQDCYCCYHLMLAQPDLDAHRPPDSTTVAAADAKVRPPGSSCPMERLELWLRDVADWSSCVMCSPTPSPTAQPSTARSAASTVEPVSCGSPVNTRVGPCPLSCSPSSAPSTAPTQR